MDSGAAGHVMLEALFARVKFELKTSPQRFEQRMVHKSETWAKINIHSRHTREVKDITIRSASVVKLLM